MDLYVSLTNDIEGEVSGTLPLHSPSSREAYSAEISNSP